MRHVILEHLGRFFLIYYTIAMISSVSSESFPTIHSQTHWYTVCGRHCCILNHQFTD